MMLAPIATADKVYTIDPSGVSVGEIAANYWTGFDSPAQRVFSSGGLKYLGDSSAGSYSDTAFVTKASGRDQEVSWKAAQTYQTDQVYLRYNGTEAVYFSISTLDNRFKAFFVKSVGRISQTAGVGSDSQVQYSFDMDSNGVSLTGLTGAFPPSVSDTWTVGCSGDTFYAKRNSVTFWTYRLWTHAKPGKIAMLISANDARGLRDVTCTFKPSAVTYSDFDNMRLDLRDWGFKDSKTTGTISGGALTTLTVADASGFSVGDPIIVEIGGEAGAGEPETVGVGGTWPTYSYVNYASLPSPATWCSSVANDTDGYAWVEDTVKVYRAYNPGTGYIWEEYTPSTQPRWYYANRVMPRALYATITNKSSNTLTLDTAATVATTNANVYYDCTPAFEALLAGDVNDGTIGGIITFSIRQDIEVVQPNGVYAVHGRYTTNCTSGWTFYGTSRANMVWYSPKGTEHFSVSHQGSYSDWHDMTFQAWAGEKYYCVDTDTGWFQPFHTIDCTGNANNGRGGETGNRLDRLDFINTFGGSHMSVTTDGGASDCRGFHTNGNLQQYTTWFFQHAYTANTFFDRMEYHADKTGTAFEIFQADGGGFRDCVSVNGYLASNYSGGDFLIENFTQDIDLDEMPTNDWMSANGYTVNINVNIGEGANNPGIIETGGRIVNPNITIRQRADGTLKSAIAVAATCPAIRIIGTHPDKPGLGQIEFIRIDSNDTGEISGIGSDAVTTITGMRVKGLTGGVDKYSNIKSVDDGTARVTNCVADTIYTRPSGGGSYVNRMGQSGNITNTAYDAL